MINRVSLFTALLCASASFAGAADDAAFYSNSRANSKAVFVMTNDAARNEILSFARQSNGSLKLAGIFRTGGRGSGGTTDPLGSQGSLTLSDDRSLLFAVNAGSGEISSFRVNGPSLRLVDVEPAGGSAPVAVAQRGHLLYVANFAGNSSITGFHVNDEGELRPIPGAIRYLSTANSGVSSLAFSEDGKFLLTTEKLTSNIDVFPIGAGGLLGAAVVTKDPSAGLFAVAVAPGGAVITVEAAARTISSFLLNADGSLSPLSGPVPTMGAATCWVAIAPNGQFAYTDNAGGPSVSGFSLLGAGMLSPLTGTVVATMPAGSTNLDIAVSGDSKFVYTLNSGTGSVGMFAIQSDGTLKGLGALPAFAMTAGVNGIAAL